MPPRHNREFLPPHLRDEREEPEPSENEDGQESEEFEEFVDGDEIIEEPDDEWETEW